METLAIGLAVALALLIGLWFAIEWLGREKVRLENTAVKVSDEAVATVKADLANAAQSVADIVKDKK